MSKVFASLVFKDAHKGRVYIRAYIRVSVHAFVSVWIVLCNLKEKNYSERVSLLWFKKKYAILFMATEATNFTVNCFASSCSLRVATVLRSCWTGVGEENRRFIHPWIFMCLSHFVSKDHFIALIVNKSNPNLFSCWKDPDVDLTFRLTSKTYRVSGKLSEVTEASGDSGKMSGNYRKLLYDYSNLNQNVDRAIF